MLCSVELNMKVFTRFCNSLHFYSDTDYELNQFIKTDDIGSSWNVNRSLSLDPGLNDCVKTLKLHLGENCCSIFFFFFG